jgi:hypothetical protein
MSEKRPLVRPRKRCRYCWNLYTPDGRLGDRQQCCGARECRSKRHSEVDLQWRERHPDYDTARRTRKLMQAAEQGGLEQVARREPEPGRRLPLDEAQDAIAPQGVVILMVFARLLRGYVQDAIRRQVAVNAKQFSDSVGPVAQDAIPKRGRGG